MAAAYLFQGECLLAHFEFSLFPPSILKIDPIDGGPYGWNTELENKAWLG
jgi:hypothetical protein